MQISLLNYKGIVKWNSEGLKKTSLFRFAKEDTMKTRKNIFCLALSIIMICVCAIPSYAMELPRKDYPVVLLDSPVIRKAGSNYTRGTEVYYGKTMTGTLVGDKTNGMATTSYNSITRKKTVSISVRYENINTGTTYNYVGEDVSSTVKTNITDSWTRPSSAYQAIAYSSSHHVVNDEGVPGIALYLDA